MDQFTWILQCLHKKKSHTHTHTHTRPTFVFWCFSRVYLLALSKYTWPCPSLLVTVFSKIHCNQAVRERCSHPGLHALFPFWMPVFLFSSRAAVFVLTAASAHPRWSPAFSGTRTTLCVKDVVSSAATKLTVQRLCSTVRSEFLQLN